MLSASMTTLVKYSVAQPLKRFDKLWQEMERDLTVRAQKCVLPVFFLVDLLKVSKSQKQIIFS